jgi:hypothetical protein
MDSGRARPGNPSPAGNGPPTARGQFGPSESSSEPEERRSPSPRVCRDAQRGGQLRGGSAARDGPAGPGRGYRFGGRGSWEAVRPHAKW